MLPKGPRGDFKVLRFHIRGEQLQIVSNAVELLVAVRDFELIEKRMHVSIAGQPRILVPDVDLDSQPSTDLVEVAAGPGFRMVFPKDLLVGMKHLRVAGMRVDVQLFGPAVSTGKGHNRS